MIPHSDHPTQLELFAHPGVSVDPMYINTEFMDRINRQLDNEKLVERIAVIHPRTVYEMLNNSTFNTAPHHLVKLIDVEVHITPRRLYTFRGTHVCSSCGIAGNVYLAERHKNDLANPSARHLNLYHVPATADQMSLMTVDHILPDSWYGRYDTANFQTMCQLCNQKKRHSLTVEDIVKIRANLTRYAKSWVDVEYLDLLLGLQLQVYQTRNTKVRNRLELIIYSYRKRYKCSTPPGEVAHWKRDLLRDVVQAVYPLAVSSPWDRLTLPGQPQLSSSTVVSWSSRIKRMIATKASKGTIPRLIAKLVHRVLPQRQQQKNLRRSKNRKPKSTKSTAPQ